MKRLIAVTFISMSFATGAIAADKHEEIGAHEHGHGSFNMAIDGNKVSMELEAPGADIVGFEYKAKTKAQKAKVKQATDDLKKIANVVGLPAAAGCAVKKASVELHIEGGDDHHDHKKKKKHSHDDHAKKASTHSEFHAEYELTCKSPGKLVEITFPYFKKFNGAEELEVKVVGGKGQKQYEVERGGSAKISLGGLI